MTTQYPNETNNLGMNGNDYHSQYPRNMRASWKVKGIKITRLRLLTDVGCPFWDVSYCHGELPDGTKVNVDLPFSQLPRRNMKKFIIEAAKADGVYAKGTGIFDEISALW